MRVLNGPAVTRDAGPDLVGRAVEVQRDKPRMAEKAGDRCRQRTERERVAGMRAAAAAGDLRSRVEVACAEDDSGEISESVESERRPASRTSIGSPLAT